MSHAITLVTDNQNRVRAQCRCGWCSPVDHPGPAVPPPQKITERVAARHLHEPPVMVAVWV